MNNFKPLDNPDEGADENLRFLNGWKTFEAT